MKMHPRPARALRNIKNVSYTRFWSLPKPSTEWKKMEKASQVLVMTVKHLHRGGFYSPPRWPRVCRVVRALKPGFRPSSE